MDEAGVFRAVIGFERLECWQVHGDPAEVHIDHAGVAFTHERTDHDGAAELDGAGGGAAGDALAAIEGFRGAGDEEEVDVEAAQTRAELRHLDVEADDDRDAQAGHFEDEQFAACSELVLPRGEEEFVLMQDAPVAEDEGAVVEMPAGGIEVGSGAEDGVLALLAEALPELGHEVHPDDFGDVFHVCVGRQQRLQGGPEVLGQEYDVHAAGPGGFNAVHDFLGKGVDGFACIADVEGPGFDFDIGLAGGGVRHGWSTMRPGS